MTYKEQIDCLRDLVNLNYTLAGGLRDTAEGKEKEIFNQVRGNAMSYRSAFGYFRNRWIRNGLRSIRATDSKNISKNKSKTFSHLN